MSRVHVRTFLGAMLFLFVTPLRASPPPKGCDVAIDNREIIRARADSDLSWYACLGYVHGRYRSFQLDLYRRTYQGRRAEILGKSQLKTDIFMRLLRLASRAEKLFDELPNEAREKFWIYAQGVAKGMTDREERFSLEFKKLGYEPEPWHPVDTMGILLLESVDQTQESFRNDFIEDGWKKVHGENARQLFDLRGLPWTTSITKELGAPHASAPLFQEPSLPTHDHSIQEILNTLPEPFQGGSNNWVVASKRSRTKHAWLANDPHLPLTSPPFWLWVDVEGPVRHAIGATVPGIPVVVSGTNGFVSWGLTTSLTDNANVYSVPRSALKLKSFLPTIWVKMGPVKLPFFFKKLEETEAGDPILPNSTDSSRALVLQWSSLAVTANDIANMVNFHDAKTADTFDREVVTRMGLPSWNWVFSDTRGHIGYRMNGRINARGTQLPFGTQRVDQLPPEAEFLAPDSLPHERDPSRGFIASANNIALPSTTPWDGGRGYRSGLRAFRIEELLQKERAHSLDTLRAIQCDVQVIDQRFLLPLLIKHVEQTASRGSIPRLISDLRIWDGNATPGCTVCGLYRRWVDLLRERLQVNLVALYRLLALQNTPIHLNEIIAETLQAAFDQTRAQPWSILHIAPFPHISNERQLLDHSPVPSPGDAESVNLGRGEWRGTAYEHTEGPSQRMIIEMARTPKIWLGFAGRNLYALSDTQANPIDWQSWAQCEIAPVAFPFDWSKKGLTFYSVSQLY